jgi:hypothetical protein
MIAVVGNEDPAVLGLNVYAAILDEANFMGRTKAIPNGTPVKHRSHPEMVGVVAGSSQDGSDWYYRIDWVKEPDWPFAGVFRHDWIEELPSAMHLLGSL